MNNHGKIKKQRNTKEPSRAQRYIVKQPNTLLSFLVETLHQQSKTSVKALLKHGRVSINNASVTHFNTALNAGDEVSVKKEKKTAPFKHPKMEIVWEDDDFIVIHKKEGLLSVSNSPTQEYTAYFILLQYVRSIDPRNKIFILHRLDKGTSGLMMFARNRHIQETMRSEWYQRITRKTYIAVVEGVPEKQSGTITTYLAENKRMKVYCTAPEWGKKAVLHYRVKKQNATYSLVELELETGRKNQIRAQMEDIGHPVVGDPKYGATTDPAGRLMLHAKCLFFTHPETGEEMRFELPVPRQFNHLVK